MKIKKYGATWCGACKDLDAKLKENSIKHEVIDVDDFPESIKEFGISKLPTTIVFDEENNEVDRFVGTLFEIEDLAKWQNQG